MWGTEKRERERERERDKRRNQCVSGLVGRGNRNPAEGCVNGALIFPRNLACALMRRAATLIESVLEHSGRSGFRSDPIPVVDVVFA